MNIIIKLGITLIEGASASNKKRKRMTDSLTSKLGLDASTLAMLGDLSSSSSPAAISNLLNMLNMSALGKQLTECALCKRACESHPILRQHVTNVHKISYDDYVARFVSGKDTSVQQQQQQPMLTGASKRKRKNSANSTLSSMSNKTTASSTSGGGLESTSKKIRTANAVESGDDDDSASLQVPIYLYLSKLYLFNNKLSHQIS